MLCRVPYFQAATLPHRLFYFAPLYTALPPLPAFVNIFRHRDYAVSFISPQAAPFAIMPGTFQPADLLPLFALRLPLSISYPGDYAPRNAIRLFRLLFAAATFIISRLFAPFYFQVRLSHYFSCRTGICHGPPFQPVRRVPPPPRTRSRLRLGIV